MTEMIERVAKVIGDEHFGYVDPKDTPNTWAKAIGMAQVAIEAMREPTDDMKLFGTLEISRNHAESVWQAMIDEALK